MPEIFNAKKMEEKKENHSHLNHTNHEPSRDLAPIDQGPLASFCYYPKHVNFIGTDSQEKIILILRRHPITNLPWLTTAFFMILAPFIVSFIPQIQNAPFGYQVVGMMTWYLITLAFMIEQFLSWFFNVHIVTDERVFDVDFVHLVHREITDANIDQIQDVTARMGGVIRTMFNYGDVLIQTAAEMPMIEYHGVPRPDKVTRILRELRVQEETEKIEGRVR